MLFLFLFVDDKRSKKSKKIPKNLNKKLFPLSPHKNMGGIFLVDFYLRHTHMKTWRHMKYCPTKNRFFGFCVLHFFVFRQDVEKNQKFSKNLNKKLFFPLPTQKYGWGFLSRLYLGHTHTWRHEDTHDTIQQKTVFLCSTFFVFRQAV